MIAEEQKIVHDSRAVLDRAMDFEDYIMRRTLGLYYIAWAAAFFLFSISPLLQNFFDRFYWLSTILFLGTFAIVFSYTGYLFKRASLVSTVVSSSLTDKKLTVSNVAFLFIFAVDMTLIFTFGFYNGLVVLYVILALYVPWSISYIARKTLRKIHLETLIAILSFFIASVASVWSIVVLKNNAILEIIWMLAAIAWVTCGIAGIYFADYQGLVIDNDE